MCLTDVVFLYYIRYNVLSADTNSLFCVVYMRNRITQQRSIVTAPQSYLFVMLNRTHSTCRGGRY